MDYDFIYLDECHSLKASHNKWLYQYLQQGGRLLGLTGTYPINSTSEKAKGFTELMAIRLKEITEKNPSDAANKVQMQEAQLIIEQLVWLINLSENILKNTKLLVEKE